MDYLISVLLVLPCARASAAAAGPLAVGRLIQFRRNAYPVYASDSGEEYEPYAVAALPLHAPVPVLQVYAPPADRRRPRPRRPTRRPHAPRPDADLYAYDAAPVEPYEPDEYEYVYASEEETQPKHGKARDQYEEDASSVVVYARPDRHGGFSYRKPAAPPRLLDAAALASAPLAQAARLREPQEPVIIRIHKYRVIH